MSSCDFMPQVLCLFWFYVYKVDFCMEIFALRSLISAASED